MGSFFQPQVIHSQLSLKLTENLKIMTIIFIVFSVLKIFILSSNTIFNDILLVLILYCFYTQLSYFIGFFAIFFILINLIFESLTVLQIIQNIIFGFSSKVVIFLVLIRLIYVTIYVFLLYLSFACSREYKALFIEQKGASVYQEYQMFTEDFDQNKNNNYGNSDYIYQRLNNNENEPKGYKPFSGQGQTWGWKLIQILFNIIH